MKTVSERKKPVKCGEGGVFEAVLCRLILLAVQNEGSILKTAALPFSSCCTSLFPALFMCSTGVLSGFSKDVMLRQADVTAGSHYI